jgi:hypothetical protein
MYAELCCWMHAKSFHHVKCKTLLFEDVSVVVFWLQMCILFECLIIAELTYFLRDLRFSWQWRFRSNSFGLWHYVALLPPYSPWRWDLWNIGILPRHCMASQTKRTWLWLCAFCSSNIWREAPNVTAHPYTYKISVLDGKVFIKCNVCCVPNTAKFEWPWLVEDVLFTYCDGFTFVNYQ